jgi:hypothetical protein
MTDKPAPLPTPPCPICSMPLDPQQREPRAYWCALCRKWFDGDLKKL